MCSEFNINSFELGIYQTSHVTNKKTLNII